MITTVDEERGEVVVRDGEDERRFPLGSEEGFAAVSRAWLRAGWDAKHVYSFTWLGRPIIQLPEDVVRAQELIFRVKPDVLIETGIAHGGSLVFYASLFKAMERGRVIGIDIEIRPHNRAAIEAHPLMPLITLVEGSSVDPAVIASVKAQLKPGETVMVALDSNHGKEHVLKELRAYAPLVTPSSYVMVADGIMEQVAGAPRTAADWRTNNPRAAVHAFLEEDKRFVLEEPEFLFNEGSVRSRVTYWPDAFLRRIAD
jgi:cephalosporin hydroxylase